MFRARVASIVRFRRQFAGALVAVVCLGAAAQSRAQQPAAAPQVRSGFQTRVFQDDSGSHKYTIFVPAGYSPARKWPVILFLHGAGERGKDGVLPTSIGLGPLVKAREANFPFIVVFPQDEDAHGRILNAWSPESPSGKRALAILGQVEKDFSVDTKREILSGWSMGGYGAWQMAAADPGRWLSVVPVSSGGSEDLAEKVKNVPIWAFHGAKDKVVRPDSVRKLIEAIKAAGGSPRYTEVADGDHNVWTEVFDNDQLYAWMLSPTSDPAKLRPVTSRPPVAPGQTAHVIPEAPFIPALDIPRAVYVRMGNEMLAAVADTVPKVIPRDMMSGYLNDISDYTEAEGYGFSVYMSGLSYSGQLVRANVKAYRQDRLNVQLALANVQVTIGGTSIQGESHSASAGPISIVIGHQRPVWLSFDVTPTVVDRKLKLQLVGTSFNIPNDNWYVSGPAGVSVRGFGLTRDKVSNGLVSGLYGKKYTIEQQVTSVVPRLVAEMEKKLDVNQFNKSAVGSLWPLPVYQPRLRLWPAEISTDDKGVSLVLGVTAAAVDPAKPPRQVRVVPATGPGVAQIPKTTKLQVGVAPEMLAPLTEMLVEADVARIHVADTPSQAMARLADVQSIVDAIPDLKRFGDRLQVTSELVLAGPINIVDAGKAVAAAEKPGAPIIRPVSTQAESKGKLAIDVPRAKVLVSIKTDPAANDWTPCAEFDVSLRQGVYPELRKPTALTRAVGIVWDDKAQIDVKGKFAEGYQAQDNTIDIEKVRAMFDAGWEEYVHGGPPAQIDLHDIDLGFTKLRATEVGWSAPDLYAVFGPPGVKLTNSTDKPMVYQTKGPYSDWGGPYTLPPGGTHEFPIAYPMVFRRQMGGTYQMFTLPVGTHSEYRELKPGQGVLYQAREPEEIEKSRPKAEEKKPEGKNGEKKDAEKPAEEKAPQA